MRVSLRFPTPAESVYSNRTEPPDPQDGPDRFQRPLPASEGTGRRPVSRPARLRRQSLLRRGGSARATNDGAFGLTNRLASASKDSSLRRGLGGRVFFKARPN